MRQMGCLCAKGFSGGGGGDGEVDWGSGAGGEGGEEGWDAGEGGAGFEEVVLGGYLREPVVVGEG